MRDHLLIYLNGRPQQIAGTDAFETLSDFLRRRVRLTGTKVVCAEGDCGACAVLIGRVSAEGTALQYQSIASCILTMFQLDGAHIITVEGLSEPKKLNPIQTSMVKCHGAQCGYCTPGFVVSLYGLMQAGQPVDATAVRGGLVGNLCRCTGYDSIIRAALATDRTQMKAIEALYPGSVILNELAKSATEELRIESKDLTFFKPVTLDSAVAFRNQNPSCLIVSGATDLGVQRNKGIRQFSVVMSTAGVKSLREISIQAEAICVGGAATLSEIEKATLTPLPEFSRFLAYFGSPMIKNAATIAGNLVNASPIGDSIPALIVLGAEIELTGRSGTRSVPISQFYTGYRQTTLKTDELLTRVLIPIPDRSIVFKLFKVSKRKDLDISSVSAAFWMREAGGIITEMRIAFGGVAATVVRLGGVERFLVGKPVTLATFEKAGIMAANAVKPLADVRGSDAYRRQLVENMLVKFWHERGSNPVAPAPAAPLPVASSSGDEGIEPVEDDDAATNSIMNR